MSAKQAVFDTFELLEKVFTNLPLLDLLTATRVNHTWRQTFERSTRTRSMLFDSKLPDRYSKIEGIRVNGNKWTPWILRSERICSSPGIFGRIFIFKTARTRFIVFGPEDRSKDMISSGITQKVTTRCIDKAVSWEVEWKATDGTLIGRSVVSGAPDRELVLMACLATMHLSESLVLTPWYQKFEQIREQCWRMDNSKEMQVGIFGEGLGARTHWALSNRQSFSGIQATGNGGGMCDVFYAGRG